MATASSKKTWSVHLFLKEDEAQYLKKLLHNKPTTNESIEHGNIRITIWEALNSGDLFNL